MCMLLCVFLVTQISEWKVVVTGELNGWTIVTHTQFIAVFLYCTRVRVIGLGLYMYTVYIQQY